MPPIEPGKPLLIEREPGMLCLGFILRPDSEGGIRITARDPDVPGPEVRSDQEIIDAGLTMGTCGYHAIATCAMGPDGDDVVDPRLRVRGVENLRVVDASVLPIMVSGNLNGPVAALAWRAADFILDG